MTSRISRPLLLAALALTVAACSTSSPAPVGDTSSAEYQKAYAIALDAYVYGLPLVTTDATFRTMTSVGVSQGAFGPVNRFNNVRSPNSSSSTTVVAPGATSLSSIAWLDLTGGPQVLHVPEVTGHFFVLALIDPYTENLVNLGTASGTEPGDYVIATRDQAADATPAGAHRIEVDYSRIWVIGSTQLKGSSDVPDVNAIQDGYTLRPLRPTTAPTSSATATTVTPYQPSTGIAFFDELGGPLEQFPPPAADSPALERFATVGIGPGRVPSKDDSLSEATRQALADAVAAGPAQIQADVKSLYADGFATHAGYLLGGFGTYGTDYVERAVISQIGLGAFVPQQAVYAMAWDDSRHAVLAGSSSYVLHLATPPPTTEGWSVTIYNLKGQLVANAGGRYAITSISPLTRNADGSLDLYLQPTAPASSAHAANWLPTPAGEGFEVTWRLFAPDAGAIDGIVDGSGWQPPAITPTG
jgi:hypothetical protein